MNNSSAACNEFSEVLHERPDGTYSVVEKCNPWHGAEGSKRLILVPVIPSLCNGRCDVTILYFAVFFLDSLDSCTGNDCQITGRFAKVVTNPDSLLGAYNANDVIKAVHLTS
jgi:hypothetical protein